MATKRSENRVSVIIPVYNTEQFFDRCITSVMEQSYHNLEIIVVNDGSPGNIRQLIQKYQEKDSRITFIDNQENLGLLKARVCGARHASGDYLAFVDSDDYLSFDYYRTLVRKAEETRADIVVGKTVWEDEGERYVYNLHESALTFRELWGDAVREAYFSQEANCYSWHTIWNKLYSKKLWKRCQKTFEAVDRHIVMTEDIFFSSILFHEAERVSRVDNDAYFYCTNKNASTNSKGITMQRFRKNMEDMAYVFDSVEEYLQKKELTKEEFWENVRQEKLLEHFRQGRMHYARMWEHLALDSFYGEEKQCALELVKKFCTDIEDREVNDYFFESVKTVWNGGLEYIKERIAKGTEQYISFDVFDTLVLRPFYEPEDLFYLLDQKYEQLTKSGGSFRKIRREGERLAREFYGENRAYQDIRIDEIYEFIGKHYQLPKDVTGKMMEEEKHLEIKFCTRRNAGKELFDLANESGKKVILITDMYLDADTISSILDKNGYRGYEALYISCMERKLKYNGGLFEQVLRGFPEARGGMLHIGDTWRSDIEGSQKAGIQSVFLPKAREVFENQIQNCMTNRCSSIGASACERMMNWGKVKENIGFRCMLALAFNRYFDNPYRTFHQGSDFNIDPWFIGYYPLGMHMLGICKWLRREKERSGYERIFFLGRDGFLPMNSFRIYMRMLGEKDAADYLQASRRVVFPAMVKDRASYYQLPVEYRGHSPRTLFDILRFCMECRDCSELEEFCRKHEFQIDSVFSTKEEYMDFISCFLEELYSPQRHQEEYCLAREYYSQIGPKDVLFDMGYSGRIQAAICRLCDHPVDALFIHEDYDSSIEMRAHRRFQIASFYDFRPSVSGLIREHIFSATEGSCIGFERAADMVVPVQEAEEMPYSNNFVVARMHDAACSFISDFMETYEGYLDLVDYSPQEVSLPFEGFLRNPGESDLHIFSESYFEDLVYGAKRKIRIEDFVRHQIYELNKHSGEFTVASEKTGLSYDGMMDILNRHSKTERALLLLILDRKLFVDKLKKNFRKILKRSI